MYQYRKIELKAWKPPWLEMLLGLSVIALVAQLAWPSVADWRQRPRPGQMVCRSAGLLAQHDETQGLLPHLLYLPSEYSSKSEWPLLLFLHGSGQRGTNLADLIRGGGPPAMLDQGRSFSFVVVAPQCPPGQAWSPQQLLALLDHIEGQLSISDVFVTGYSMGGHGTWHLAQAAPERFAAIAPVCGGGDIGKAETLKELPIWAFHGATDQVVPLQSSEEIVNAVQDAGGSAKLNIYPQRGHGICGVTYADQNLYDWMHSQVTITKRQKP